MIDSHCHIGFENEDPAETLAHARSVGVTRVLSVACSLSDYGDLLKNLNQYSMMDGAFGIHPEYADSLPSDSEFKEKISAHPRLLAIGECGLDYHYVPETKKLQQRVFEHQIEIAYHVQKPIIIHAREAEDDILAILGSANKAGLLKYGGVLHCFTGTQQLADQALEMGLYLSASGVITFKNATDLCRVFETVPLNRLLVETDSPYLAPIPYRGKKNEPAFVMQTAEKLAALKHLSLSEIDQITTENYHHLFQAQEVPHAS